MLTQTKGVTAEPSGDKVIALDAAGENMITLSPVGSLIWQHLTEARSFDDIVDHMAATFPDVARDQLQADARSFVDELLELGLLSEDG